MHCWPIAQAFPHAPQFASSLFRFRHTPPQFVWFRRRSTCTCRPCTAGPCRRRSRTTRSSPRRCSGSGTPRCSSSGHRRRSTCTSRPCTAGPCRRRSRTTRSSPRRCSGSGRPRCSSSGHRRRSTRTSRPCTAGPCRRRSRRTRSSPHRSPGSGRPRCSSSGSPAGQRAHPGHAVLAHAAGVPAVPQFASSFIRFRQIPPQFVWPPPQVNVHIPAMHCWPMPQALPQAPQFASSFFRFRQTPPPRKISGPWSRRRWTQPASRAVVPASDARSWPAVWVR